MSKFHKYNLDYVDACIGDALEVPLSKSKEWSFVPFFGTHVGQYGTEILVDYINTAIKNYESIDAKYGDLKSDDPKYSKARQAEIKKKQKESAELKANVESLQVWQKKFAKHILDNTSLYIRVEDSIIVTPGFGDVGAVSDLDDIREIFEIPKSKPEPKFKWDTKYEISDFDEFVQSKLKWMTEKFVITDIPIGKYIRDKSVKTMRSSRWKGEFLKMIEPGNFANFKAMFKNEFYSDWNKLLAGDYEFKHYKLPVKDKPAKTIDEKVKDFEPIPINFPIYYKLITNHLSSARAIEKMYKKYPNANRRNKKRLKRKIKHTCDTLKMVEDAHQQIGYELFCNNSTYALSKGEFTRNANDNENGNENGNENSDDDNDNNDNDNDNQDVPGDDNDIQDDGDDNEDLVIEVD